MKIKGSAEVVLKDGLYYVLDEKGKIRKFKPWLGDIFAFAYDPVMRKSVFPKKFKGSFSSHCEILRSEYQSINNKRILEIATGSGFSSEVLNSDNSYTGIDMSAGLLKQAVRKFQSHQFTDAEFYVSAASDLPFCDGYFDTVVCDLSLNFLGDIESFLIEIRRVMKPGAVFNCSVPVPEKKDPGAVIHGRLYHEAEIKSHFEENGFIFTPMPYHNGALLYFKAQFRPM